MDTKQGRVLIVGADGHHGGAAARELRRRGLPVRALLHEPSVPAAHMLQELGVQPVYADPDDVISLEHALEGVDALLLVMDDAAGPAHRLRRGKAMAAAAARAGVSHVVLAASTGADHHLAACDQSRHMEEHLRGLGLPVTVLRPATVMEEIPWYWLSRFGRELVLATPFPESTRLPLISAEDVGALAARAVAEPQEFRGRTIEAAGDAATLAEVTALLSEELAEPVRYTEVQVEGVFIYSEASTPAQDIAWLRSVHPSLRTLRAWLRDGGGLELCRQAAPSRAA